MRWSSSFYVSLLAMILLNSVGNFLPELFHLRAEGVKASDSYYGKWRDKFRVSTNFIHYINGNSFNFIDYFGNMREKFTEPFQSAHYTPQTWNCTTPCYNPGDSFGDMKSIADFIVWQNSSGYVYYNNTGTHEQFGGDDKFAEEIQDALNNLSSSGGIVYIEDGIYILYDGILIPRSNVILSGDGWETIIRLNETINWSGGHYMITGNSEKNIIIKDLTIDGNMGASAFTDDTSIEGIRTTLCQNLAVLNVNITRIRKHGFGPALSNYTYLFNSWLGNNGWNDANPNRNYNASIIGNLITQWRDVGISTWSSINVYIVNNVIAESVYDGMGYNTANWGVGVEPGSRWQGDSYNIVIRNNLIEKCNASAGIKGTGIAIGTVHGKRPWNIVVYNNTIKYTKWGIRQWSTDDNKEVRSKISIQDNNIVSNVEGIWLKYSSNNTIFGNNISNNSDHGIVLDASSFNLIYRNNIICNNGIGIHISESDNNKIFHNSFIDNPVQASLREFQPRNSWDSGYPYGGNYWSDYNCTDFFEGSYQNETGGDGIGDTPRTIDAENQDRYPLINPLGSPQLPISFFAHRPEHPVTRERITFDASLTYDRDGFIKSYGWNFGDNNETTVTVSAITHFYSSKGTYRVNLTVIDNDGFSHSMTNNVTIIDAQPLDTLITPHLFTGIAVALTGMTVATVFLWKKRKKQCEHAR